LWYGWSGPEPSFRWTDGHEAAIIFSLEDQAEMHLRMKMSPFLSGNAVAAQDVSVELNGNPLAALRLDAPESKVYSMALPRESLRERNVLRFKLPDAASPLALNAGEDERLLGLSVEWIEFQSTAALVQ
jgi:hypothetical protein